MRKIEEKKYEILDERDNLYGRILHRIRAVRDFGAVRKGDLGGFVEREENLSHEGTCWIILRESKRGGKK